MKFFMILIYFIMMVYMGYTTKNGTEFEEKDFVIFLGTKNVFFWLEKMFLDWSKIIF